MSAFELTVRGGTVVTAEETKRADLGIRDGKIVAVEETLSAGAEDIRADDLLVLPGGVDSHVHVDQPFSSGAQIADTFSAASNASL